MLVALEAADDETVEAGLAELAGALAEAARPAPTGFGDAPPIAGVAAAVRSADAATVVLISTPGDYAFADAVDAVDAGLTTMVFSDNVPVEQEVALKRRTAGTGALVMGPDCGTAVIGGLGLGFANVVEPGPVGVVAASGTGAQHLMSLLDLAGVGVTHCLGVGGRDLSEAVGGLSTLRALDLLEADPAVELVVVVSKPPSDAVAERVRSHAAGLATPVLFGLLGPGLPDLTETAAGVVAALGRSWSAPQARPGAVPGGRPGGYLRGLFSGGTLCDEAMLLATDALGPVSSNIPLAGAPRLAGDLKAEGHTMIDFGDDQLTRGRPHPMIDGTLRAERIRAEAADASAGVLLLDVVLGHGADDDPAATLADPVRTAVAAGLPVVARSSARGATRRASSGSATRWRPPGPPCTCRTPTPPERPWACWTTREGPDEPVDHPRDRRHGRCRPAGRRGRATGGADRAGRLAATGRRPRGAGSGDGRPPSPGRQPAGGLGHARGAGPAHRRTSGGGGARARARPVSARRSADRLGAAPPARCAARSIGAMLLEGLAGSPGGGGAQARFRRRRQLGALPPPRRRSARWPGSCRRRCGSSSSATTYTATRRGAR